MSDKKTLVFATNNPHKLEELRQIVGDSINILSLDDIDCHEDIPEECPTLRENAIFKARFIKDKFGFDCFADDTGLEVDALNGQPGVKSARYAPDSDHNSIDNMNYLLDNMKDIQNRIARFRTVIALVEGDKITEFEGIVEGEILKTPVGDTGFGYDPVFRPSGWNKSFAQASTQEKNNISHRSRATRLLLEYLNNNR